MNEKKKFRKMESVLNCTNTHYIIVWIIAYFLGTTALLYINPHPVIIKSKEMAETSRTTIVRKI